MKGEGGVGRAEMRGLGGGGLRRGIWGRYGLMTPTMPAWQCLACAQ